MKHGLFASPVSVGILWLLVVCVWIGNVGCTGGGSHSSLSDQRRLSQREQAVEIYHEVWRAIQQEYVDDTFNGQRWPYWEHRYDTVITDAQDAYVAVDTMLASLNDDYTRFLPPREMNEQSMQIDSRVYGVGIQIMVKNKKLTVVGTLSDTPADKAGIEPNDMITHIEGEPTAGLTVQDAADRIRGEKGTPVRLTIQRKNPKNISEKFDVALYRDEIKIKTVFTKELPQKEIGYIRLNTFISEDAVNEMKEAIQKLSGKRALILDLRGNYGGLLSNAVEISDLFLEEGCIVSIEGRSNRYSRQMNAQEGNDVEKKPLVILIDGGSASASEILSGALKDHHRATLVGTRSFGKGLVQKINPLKDGSGLNITISRYLTPNGVDINKVGIEPDIIVPFTREDLRQNRDPQLKAAVDHLLHKRLTARTGQR